MHNKITRRFLGCPIIYDCLRLYAIESCKSCFDGARAIPSQPRVTLFPSRATRSCVSSSPTTKLAPLTHTHTKHILATTSKVRWDVSAAAIAPCFGPHNKRAHAGVCVYHTCRMTVTTTTTTTTMFWSNPISLYGFVRSASRSLGFMRGARMRIGCYYRAGRILRFDGVPYFMHDYYDYDYDDGDDYYMVIKNKALFRRPPPRGYLQKNKRSVAIL